MINKYTLNVEKDFVNVSFKKETKKTKKGIIIPNVSELAREMTSKSQIGIIIDRVLKLGPVDWFSLGKNNIISAPHLLRKDFATGIKILCELEILRRSNGHYILHNQFVDMAIALNSKGVLSNFFKLSRSYKFKPGVVTYNIGPFIKHLSTINRVPENLVVYTPLNPRRHQINPSLKDVVEFIRNSDIEFVNI